MLPMHKLVRTHLAGDVSNWSLQRLYIEIKVRPAYTLVDVRAGVGAFQTVEKQAFLA